jgi:hypothetical protein
VICAFAGTGADADVAADALSKAKKKSLSQSGLFQPRLV